MTSPTIIYSRDPEHAEKLRRGLTKMPRGFNACICGACDGRGEREQVYTIGCGMGTTRMMGDCGWCAATGLLQGGNPAPISVVNQVLNAA